MIRLNKTAQYLLGNIFQQEQATGEQSTTPDVSLFSEIQNLFSEGMTEESFISQYKAIMSGSLFASEDNKLSLSSDDLKNIEDVAKQYFKFVDKDGNGIISGDEVKEIASSDGNEESISEEDIKTLTSNIFTEETPETAPIEVSKPTPTVSTYNPGSGSYNPGGSQKTQGASETMTLEQLQQQKTQKQNELTTAQSSLKSVYAQGNENVNSARDNYNSAVQNDESISKELKEQNSKVQQAYSAKEAELGGLKSSLVDVNGNISNYNSIISAKNSDISALKSALSNIDESKDDGAQKKTEIQSKITQAEAELKDAQDKLKEAETQKTELEGKITTAQSELTELGTQKSEVESLIASSGSDETKKALEAYQSAQTEADKAVKTAEANIVTLQGEVDKLDKQINDKNASKIQTDYRQTKLDKTYTLNGEEYLSLLSQDELDAFLKGEYSRGNYNHDSNCLDMSYVYSKDLMKQLGISGSCTDFINDDQASVEEKARQALDNGYPVIMHVSTQRGTRHFATAVGYRVTNEGKLVFLLADNVQGVGITACGEGERRHMITGYSTPYKNQNYGFRCMVYG
ncbi:hypothetical protein IKQ26_01220 [bacterium]|nr:hypothetical protein [bacterium]